MDDDLQNKFSETLINENYRKIEEETGWSKGKIDEFIADLVFKIVIKHSTKAEIDEYENFVETNLALAQDWMDKQIDKLSDVIIQEITQAAKNLNNKSA